MCSGINVGKVDALKIELLDYIESINSISNRLEVSASTIQNNVEGFGKKEILQKLGQIREQLPKVSANITTYIDDLNRAISNYERIDEETAADLIRNISKLGEGSD